MTDQVTRQSRIYPAKCKLERRGRSLTASLHLEKWMHYPYAFAASHYLALPIVSVMSATI